MAKYRYPGTQSFQPSDTHIFYGRDADIQHLMRLVRLEQLVVLYGKSGLGKTSLLNAGVLPRLKRPEPEEDPGLHVQEVRYGAFQKGTDSAPLQILENQIWNQGIHPLITGWSGGKDELWCRAKSWEMAQTGEKTLLLAFDQFEELFTYPEAAVSAFKEGLAGLIQEGSPLWLRSALAKASREKHEGISREERRRLLAPLRIKVLLSVRSDRLSLLDQFTSHLPNILVNLYEIKPLSAQASRAAIVKPAEQAGAGFDTPPFSYSPAAVDAILKSLSNQQGEIEPFQLQLLCQYLEQKVAADPSLSIIAPGDFNGSAGIQEILHSYYERQLAALSEQEQQTARHFIEEGLVVDGRRAALTAGSERERFGVSTSLLDKLLESRLIRSANIHLGKIYELSHDTLVEPVEKARENRRAQEERQRIEAELQRAEEQNREERRRRYRARFFAIVGFSLFVISALAGSIAWRKYQEAERNKQRASAAALAARSWEIFPNDNTLAFRVAEAALLIDPGNAEVEQTLHEIANHPQASFYKKVLLEHQFEIEAVAFSRDGQKMATASHDQRAILWTADGLVIHQYLGKLSGENQPGHRDRAQGVAFSADGKLLASVGADAMVKIWNVASGSLEREWKGHETSIEAVAASLEGKWLATAGQDYLAHLWTWEGEKIATLSGHTAGLTDIRISENGQRILTASLDGTAKLWTAAGKMLASISTDGTPINAADFVPGREELLLALKNNLAERVSYTGQRLATYSGHKGQVTDLAAFPHSPYLLTASEDGTARAWAYDGEEVLTLAGHHKRLNFARISPDEKTIVTGGFDFTVKLWDVSYNLDVQRRKHKNFIYRVDISPDDAYILTASVDGSAKIWQRSGQWSADLTGHTNSVQSAYFVPDKAEAITASQDGSVRVWDFAGKELLQLRHPAAFNMALATAGREKIIACTADGWIKTWDGQGKPLAEWRAGDSSRVSSIDLHAPSGKIASTQRNSVKVWDMKGTLLGSFAHPSAEVVHFAVFSSDGQSTFTAAREYPVRQWSLSGELLQTYYGHSEECYQIAVHPTLPLIASASWDQTLKIWNTADGSLQQSIAHPNGVYSVSFSNDSSFLVSGSHDNIGRIWSPDGQLIAALGKRVRLEDITNSQQVAPLSAIPFSLTEINLPSQYLSILAGSNPAQYLREAEAAIAKAQQNRHNLAEKLDYFQQGIGYLKIARKLGETSRHADLDQRIAEAYQLKGDQLINAHRFNEALQAFDEGLKYAERDYLLVLKTLALAYSGQDQKAVQMCQTYRGRPTPQIEWYENFDQAVRGDLAYFKNNFGLVCQSEARLMDLLADE
jgi:WD40 repeat protein